MAFTTGMLFNTKDFGTASANAAVLIHNEDAVNTAQIVVEIFYTLSTGVARDAALFPDVYGAAEICGMRTFLSRVFWLMKSR
ncbi:hypothetical protein [Paenibacillus sp. GbtcB18]|uniref:hypothetical protein n=1 Tax=Paenibacillus sp. GbtcB18 TaxID=2824763 RepID=UPI0020C5D173|nr:hypothetical protein [Paenibacillus sp. GbtcB18]